MNSVSNRRYKISMASLLERAQQHRLRARQFRKLALDSSVPAISDTYLGLADMDEILAAAAERLSEASRLRSERLKPVKWLRRKPRADHSLSPKAK
jgi:hypothetical protein